MRYIFLFLCINLFASSVSAQAANDTIEIKKSASTIFIKNNEVLNLNQLKEVLNSKKASQEEARIASDYLVVSRIFGAAAGFMIGYPLGTMIAGNKPNWNLALGGLGILVVSIPFNSATIKHFKKALYLYNHSTD